MRWTLLAAILFTALTRVSPARAADADVDAAPDAATDTNTGAAKCTDDGSGPIESAGTKSCAPFRCRPTTGRCGDTCASSNDCAAEAVCDGATGACVVPAHCTGDGTARVAPDGTKTSCVPYRCAIGHCNESCNIDGDCVAGTICQDGACTNPRAAVPEDDGCGFGARRALTGGAVAVALALVGLVSRRRR